MKCLFICAKPSFAKELKTLCSAESDLTKKSHSGIGTIHQHALRGFGFIVMSSKVDLGKLCRRMHKAVTTLNYKQVAIIQYETITYNTFKVNHLDVPHNLYIINDRMTFNSLMSTYNIFVSEDQDRIFRKKAPPKKRAKKREPINEDKECVICFDKSITHMILPCLHYQFCEGCVKQLKDTCPICRKKIEKIVKPIGK